MNQMIEPQKISSVGFLLLDNFSLTCFTQCLDVLVTANLIQPGSIKVHTFSRNDSEVISDLAIPIRPDTPLTDIRIAALDLMVVCGGLRTPRVLPNGLITLLTKLAEHAHCARWFMERRLVPGQGRTAGWLSMRHSCRTTYGIVRVCTQDNGDVGHGGVRQGPAHRVKPCRRVSNHDEVALRRARSEPRGCRV